MEDPWGVRTPDGMLNLEVFKALSPKDKKGWWRWRLTVEAENAANRTDEWTSPTEELRTGVMPNRPLLLDEREGLKKYAEFKCPTYRYSKGITREQHDTGQRFCTGKSCPTYEDNNREDHYDECLRARWARRVLSRD